MDNIIIDGKEYTSRDVKSWMSNCFLSQLNPSDKVLLLEESNQNKFYHCVHNDAIRSCCCKCGADLELNLKTCPIDKACVYTKTTVPVPKEIEFALITDSETGSDIGLGLLKNNKELFYDEMDGNYNFGSYGVIDEKPIECILVPCEHNNFKAGEWGFGLLTEEMPNECDLKEISNYVLWIGKDRVVCMKEEKSADELYTTFIVEEYTTNPLQWFKVVPKYKCTCGTSGLCPEHD